MGENISFAAAPLAKLLDDPQFEVRRNALQALNWVADELDITACLPVLNEHLLAGRQCDAALEVLQTMQVAGGQSIAPALDGVIAAVTVSARAAHVLELLFEKGADVSRAAEQIFRALEAPKLEPFHDRLVTVLMKSSPSSRERLLAHPRERVRKVASLSNRPS